MILARPARQSLRHSVFSSCTKSVAASGAIRPIFRPIPQIRMATQFTQQKLNSGHSIPALGFGTWQSNEQEAAVLAALKAGCRHIDGAHIYGTEPAVGRAIKTSQIPRTEIFLTTKLWNNAHSPSDVEKQCDASLANLQTEYIDLYLMHWPSAFKSGDELMPRDSNGKIIPIEIDYLDTWKAMEALVKKGKVRAIGVSNFSQAELERLVKNAEVKPADHQLECHPYLQQKSFMAWHKEQGIHVTQYSPFGNQNAIYSKGENMGKLMDDPVLVEIGKKYGKSGAQVALAWGINSGRAVIPKSATPERIRGNMEGDFKLSEEDMETIAGMDRKLRFNNPSEGFGYTFYKGLDGV